MLSCLHAVEAARLSRVLPGGVLYGIEAMRLSLFLPGGVLHWRLASGHVQRTASPSPRRRQHSSNETTPSTRRVPHAIDASRSGTRATRGGGGGCAAKRSVTSTDVQARACFMCAATPLTCVYPTFTPSPRC